MKLIVAIVGMVAAAEMVPVGLLGEIGRLSAVGVLGFLAIWEKLYGAPARDKAISDVAKAINELRAHCTKRND